MNTVFRHMVLRELRLAVRQPADVLTSLLFFVMIVTLFPLAVSPDKQLLQTMGGGVIWIAALLSTLLSLDRLFRSDYEDGCLEQMLISPQPLAWLVTAKIVAYWLIAGLPLVLMAPLLGAALYLPWLAIKVLMLGLLLGTPILVLIGAISSAITVSLGNRGVLLALLVLPLYIPLLIFGAGSVVLVQQSINVWPQLLLMTAFLILSLTLCPFVIASALFIGSD